MTADLLYKCRVCKVTFTGGTGPAETVKVELLKLLGGMEADPLLLPDMLHTCPDGRSTGIADLQGYRLRQEAADV